MCSYGQYLLAEASTLGGGDITCIERARKPVVWRALKLVALLFSLAYLSLSQSTANCAVFATSHVAVQAESGMMVTVNPPAVSLDSSSDKVVEDLDLHLVVPPSSVVGEFAISVSEDLPDGMTALVTPVGPLLTDRDGAGHPTGDLRQRVRLSLLNLPRRLVAADLMLTVSLGQLTRTVEVSVENVMAPPTGASLGVELPSDVRWSAGTPVPLVLSTHGAPAPNITLAAGPFIDPSSKRSAALTFCLADEPEGRCASSLSLRANEQRQLFLVEKGEGHTPAGTYSGSVRLLSANGLNVSATVNLEISTTWWPLVGLLALAAGALLSFLLTILWPYRRNRDLALRPFSTLQLRLDNAQRRRADIESPNLDTVSARVADQITPAWLMKNGLLGSPWPPATGNPPDSVQIKDHLDMQAAAVTAVELISDAMRSSTPGQRGALDQIANTRSAFPPSDVNAAISAALGQLPVARRVEALPSLEKIADREIVYDQIYWLCASLIAIALGYVVLVEGKPAFGGPQDLLAAFLWSFGLSATGSKIADLTAGSIRMAVRPRTAASP